jgi:hypothetical protein
MKACIGFENKANEEVNFVGGNARSPPNKVGRPQKNQWAPAQAGVSFFLRLTLHLLFG